MRSHSSAFELFSLRVQLVISRMVIWCSTTLPAAALKEPIPRATFVTFGYNRDGKRGHEQMVIALLCSAEGVRSESKFLPGTLGTPPEKIAQLQRQYGLKEIIFVGDRGMITKTVADKIKGTEGLHTISALTHRQIVELLNARSSPRSF